MKCKIFDRLKGKKRSVIKRKNMALTIISFFLVAAVPITSGYCLVMKIPIKNIETEIFTEDIELKYNISPDYDTNPIILELSSVNEFYYQEIYSNLLCPLSPPVTVDKKVRINSDDPWTNSITAHIGTVLQFQIKVKNNKIFFRPVAITDLLPSILDYVYGSASPEPNEYFNETEEGLIWLMNIGGFDTETLTFKAKIVEVGYGENYVVVAPLTGEESDEDTVPITSTNDPPNTPSTPDGPTELKPNEEGEYCTSATDPDEDKVMIRFDWEADGSHDYSDWSDLVTSGTEVCISHLWESSGQYKVKAQAKDEFGNTSSWSNGLSVIVNNPPNTPSNPEPEDGKTNIDINANLSWTCSDPDGDDLTYDVYFGTNSNPPKVSTGLTETTYNPGTMSDETTYFWKIVAFDDYGATTSGPVWSFTTSSENDPPYEPSNPSPEDNAIGVSITTSLSWTCGDPNPGDTITYDIYFGTNSSPPLIKSNHPTTTYNNLGTLNYNTTYYWKIIAKDNHGVTTEGPLWSFTTLVNSSNFIVLNPTDDAFIKHGSPKSNYGSSIQLLVRNDYGSNGGSGWAYDSLIKFNLSSIPQGTTISSAILKLYYFYKKDNDPSGRPLNLYRVNNSWSEDTVTWDTQPSYATSPSTNSTVPGFFDWMNWDVTFDVYNMISGQVTNYGWKITDENYWGKLNIPIVGYYSKEYNNSTYWPKLEIIISNQPPYTPSNPNPVDGATGVDVNSTLSWNCSDPDNNELTYDVYFEANDSTPDVMVSENQTETTYNPGTMEYETTYYWKIIAWDEYEAFTEGPVWNFTTELEPNNPPYKPNNPDPSNGATDVDIDADLSWTCGDPDEGDTVVYDVFLESNDSTPDKKVADGISENTFNPGILEYDTLYYWQIIAKDNHEATTNGPIWHFTTKKPGPEVCCDGGLNWVDITPGSLVVGELDVWNCGESESELNWEISEYPDWGDWTFTPESGSGLTPEDGHVTVDVEVIVPDDPEKVFTGNVKIVNSDDSNDYCVISVYLKTPVSKEFYHPRSSQKLTHVMDTFPLFRYLLSA